ncbi:cAMP-binding domain of CRP or a regulatory subunit of cAMP-dependent protein kinases [Chryseobacterium soldanellicola]|uniref:cAMP-binding domain of CRP or a regulatory subunit of cAMP-dependent protein kinases n=1 Tax=Chryseobacterium soldanellicola TaxID=311333 RepID=A0A1H1GA72_9FLAO|nr:Crp/Fnr family transcriptional regulator [Chryseobacterium soldanellicola]SDR10154.1 cAMP-binding domain of CRP or a regulatory subunit of cAMP-dependent protein kinases [Chryseobacterium soldanellicola]
MIISENLLLAYGADYEKYEASQIIFNEGSLPKFYFQIVDGIIELNNYHEDGKEFTQNILSSGQSFGESLLFNDKPYPMNAVSKTDCTILKLPKTDFLSLLSQNPQVSLDLFKCLSDRLFYKYIMLFNVSSQDPLSKIKTVMNYLKDYNSSSHPYSFQVPLTRQQIANLTGLRVETVIRTVKKMENEKLVKIENGKIFY